MDLVLQVRGRFDDVEILLSEELPEQVRDYIEDTAIEVRGVESVASNRYSLNLVVAAHVTTVEAVTNDVIKLFEEAKVKSWLKEAGVERIRVVRPEGERSSSDKGPRTSEIL